MPTTAALIKRQTAGDRVALVEGVSGNRVTWSQVAASAEAWGRSGLAGRRVGVAVADPLGAAVAFLGALAAGVTIAPVNPEATESELARQSLALGLSVLVTDSYATLTAAGAVSGSTGLEIRGVDLRTVKEAAAAGDHQRPGGDGAALIMSSSGTTGTPKVIPLSEAQLLHTARSVVETLRLTADDTGYSPLPLWHINGLIVGVLSAAVAGSRLVVDRRFSRRAFWSVVEAQRVTWLNLVPAIITVLAGADDPPLASTARVRLARSASAPLADAVRRRFEDRYGIPVVETYGMTEAGSQITANPIDGCRPGSVGLPVGVAVQVMDRDGRPAAAGEAGIVHIRGESVTAWYWQPGPGGGRRPAVDTDGWLATGDVGRLDDEGYLYLLGREDDVINRGGEKVQPREVEEVLLSDPRVVAAAVVGRPHPTVGEEPVAYVIATPQTSDRAALVADLEAHVASSLSRFKRPACITVVDTLPSGPTGKVRREAVRELAAAASRTDE